MRDSKDWRSFSRLNVFFLHSLRRLLRSRQIPGTVLHRHNICLGNAGFLGFFNIFLQFLIIIAPACHNDLLIFIIVDLQKLKHHKAQNFKLWTWISISCSFMNLQRQFELYTFNRTICQLIFLESSYKFTCWCKMHCQHRTDEQKSTSLPSSKNILNQKPTARRVTLKVDNKNLTTCALAIFYL